jgi:hypothetical protein
MVNKVLIPGNFRDNKACSQSKTAAKVTAEAMAQSTAVRGLTAPIPPNGKSEPRWESDNAATVTTNPPPEYWVGWSPVAAGIRSNREQTWFPPPLPAAWARQLSCRPLFFRYSGKVL